MNEAVLELRDLRKSYHSGKPNQIDVLVDAQMTLKEGEIVAVAPSGAGKSTLLHIAGLWTSRTAGMWC